MLPSEKLQLAHLRSALAEKQLRCLEAFEVFCSFARCQRVEYWVQDMGYGAQSVRSGKFQALQL